MDTTAPGQITRVTPYLTVRNATSALDFYVQLLGARELRRIVGEDGLIGFAELQVGDYHLMLSDEYPEGGVYSPQHYNGTSVDIHLYVDDVDRWSEHFLALGMRQIRAVADQPAGVRNGIFECPFGHRWFISMPIA